MWKSNKRLSSDFLWHDFSNNNIFFTFDQTVNYEDTASQFVGDLPVLPLFLFSEFNSNYTYIDSLTKLSFLDLLVMHQNNYQEDFIVSNLYFSFLLDLCSDLLTKNPFLFCLFRSDNQDLVYTVIHYCPELILAYRDYDYYLFNDFIVSKDIAAYTDIFYDSNNFTLFDSLEYLVLNTLFFTTGLIFMHTIRVTLWSSINEVYLPRVFFYLSSASRDFRFQLDALLMTFLFMVFYSVLAIMSFDDDQQVSIEFITTFWFLLFLFVIIFLIFKHSFHYFSFLEMSISEGKSSLFIIKQFVRDLTNTFALGLRFTILLFRLNVYDGLDDLYDSYYFFLGDFDEDDYSDEIFYSLFSSEFFISDNGEDLGYLKEEEYDWSFDFFHLYFIIWGKFFFFLLFLVEEAFRVILAIYIIYLISFDVHAVNCSYVEDFYFSKKRMHSREIGCGGVMGFDDLELSNETKARAA